MDIPDFLQIAIYTVTAVCLGLWDILNSSFGTALAGAGAGALGAHWIAQRANKRKEILEEIRSLNAAITITASIFNVFVSFKEQAIKPLKEQYDKQRNHFVDNEGNESGEPDPSGKVLTDLRFLDPLVLPNDILQQLSFQKISLNGRPLSLTTALVQTENSLNRLIGHRNELCHFFRENGPWKPKTLFPIYFGMPDESGSVDDRYRSALLGIDEKANDGIFFANLLCADLVKHGKKLAEKMGKDAPVINRVDFSEAEKKGLIPPREKYITWFTAFGEHSPRDEPVASSAPNTENPTSRD